VALVVVGVQEAVRGRALDDLSELPSEVHRVLHTEAEALSTRRVMDVRGVPGKQHPSGAVGGRLARRVGEPRDPGRVVDPEVGAEHIAQRLAEIAHGGLGARADLSLGYDDPDRLAILHRAEGVDARRVVTEVLFGSFGHLHLGDQVASRRIPPRELDTGRPADQAPSSVAADEILRP
jgi:hypothetical protein